MCSMSRPIFQGLVDVAPLQGGLAVAMGFSSDKDFQFLFSAIIFACLDLVVSAKITQRFFDETWLDDLFGMLDMLECCLLCWLWDRVRDYFLSLSIAPS